ncbi:carboxypeptidase-like regulatory domain-containing protein [Paenibacillus sp. 2RAB27]|uniref:carboxypeptidase-like regulatory domain-containing protein n=1 Tax=Paenibacillus sp. 2RAB27 TaxID=3232991 RepID=UPI003F96EF60
MIFKLKKVIISSILAALVIFGAVAPMASAAGGGSTRVSGYQPDFNYYADSNTGSIHVYNLDPDTSKVVLYDANGVEAGSAVNANPVVNNQITTGQTLLDVEFKNVTPGLYTVAEFAGVVKSAPSEEITLGLKHPESTFSWDPTALGTVHVTNLTPGAVVSLLKAYQLGEVLLQPTQIADINGEAVFTGVSNGIWYVIKQEFTALDDNALTSYSNSAKYLATNYLPSMDIVTNAQGDVTVSKAIPNAELRLYHVSIDSTNNTTVTSDVYLSTIAPANGIVTFPAAATVVARYRVVEINGGYDRSNSFSVEPHAPILSLSSTGTGVVITGALPNANITIYNSSINRDFGGTADENGTLTFDQVPAGKYTAAQASPFNSCSYGDNSNEIIVQKWMTRHLYTGWNTLSVPFALKTATLQAILGDHIAYLDKAYAYDNTTSQWVALTTANQAQYLSKPQTALYINLLASTNEDVYATFNATSDITPPSVLPIKTGWNLVGPSFLEIGGSPRDFLTGNSLDIIPMLISPNGQGFVYNKSNNNGQVINTLGYWVYAKSATNLIGQISTGNVSDLNDWDLNTWVYYNRPS